MGHAAVIEGEVGEDSCFFIGAIGEDEGALVFGVVDETALGRVLEVELLNG